MTEPRLTEEAVREMEARMNATPEGPWFAAADAAKECGPHRDSGLALVDTGRESDWPIARLCEWHKARFIAHSREDMAALIRDWRAMRAQLVEATEIYDAMAEVANQTEQENAALREQLAHANSEVRGVLGALGDNVVCSRPDGGAEDIYESLAISVARLQSQLAQVTSGRDELRAAFVRATETEVEL